MFEQDIPLQNFSEDLTKGFTSKPVEFGEVLGRCFIKYEVKAEGGRRYFVRKWIEIKNFQ